MNEVLPFFMYGSARVGCGLHWMIKPLVEASTIGTVRGMELMLHPDHDNYPYLVDRSPEKKPVVWGDVVLLRNTPMLGDFAQMEVGAGYDLEAIRVDHHLTGVGALMLAFVWRRDTEGFRPIGANSWLQRGLGAPR